MSLKNRTSSTTQFISLIGTVAASVLLGFPALAVSNSHPSTSLTNLDNQLLIAKNGSSKSGNGSSSRASNGSTNDSGRSGNNANGGNSSDAGSNSGNSSNNSGATNDSGRSGNNANGGNSSDASSSGSSASTSNNTGGSRDVGRGSGSANDGGLYRNTPVTPSNSNDGITDSFGVRTYDGGNTGTGDSSGSNR